MKPHLALIASSVVYSRLISDSLAAPSEAYSIQMLANHVGWCTAALAPIRNAVQ